MPPTHHIVETDDGSFDSAANDMTPDQLLSLYYAETATTTPGLAMATIGNGPHTTPSTTFVPLTTTTSSSSTTTPTPSTTTQQPSILPTTAIPSVSASQAASESGTTHKGTSSAAIGVIVTLLILALSGAAFFLVRRKYIRDRQRRRATWNQASFTQEVPPASPKDDGDKFDIVDIDEKGATPLPDNVTYTTLTMPNYSMPAPPKPLHAAAFAPPRMPSPPPVIVTSSDNPQLITATPFGAVKAAHASMASSNSSASAMNAQVVMGHLVVVARTFVPSLPDELSIQTGEQVRVINRFDDGWAHVERTRSGAGAENGVVPVECLETLPLFTLESATASIASGGTNGAGLVQEAVEGWRLSKRKSSLVPAGSVLHY